MTRWFGSGLVVIPNQVLNLIQDLALVRDLGFEFWVLKPRPVGGVLYLFSYHPDSLFQFYCQASNSSYH